VRQVPLAVPGVIEIDLGESMASLTTQRALNQIELPLLQVAEIGEGVFAALSAPTITPNVAAINVNISDVALTQLDATPDVTNGGYESLQPPKRVNLGLSFLYELPKIINLFEAIKAPGRDGKAYHPVKPATRQSSLFDAKAQRSEATRSDDRCPHGKPRSLCHLCDDAPQKTKGSPIRTVNVFELLLPYLQPPIQVLLAHPLLFPSGRRPLDYQIEGIKFLAEKPSALLGDEMGLGKTIQAIVALQVLYRRGKARHTLILCPRSLLGTWERELDKWAPEFFVLKVRGSRADRRQLWRTPATIFLTTYETLRQDIDDLPELTDRFHVTILDEIQKTKNSTTGVSRAVRKIRSAYRWGLSGTPLENSIEDVTSIFGYLKPDLFHGEEIPTPDQVKRRIQPYFLRRRAKDVLLELPSKMQQEVWLELSDAQAATYAQAEKNGRLKLSRSDATRVHVFALINELKQICNIDPETGESCKADYLEDQLDGVVESGQKALVFSHLPHVSLARLLPRLQGFGAATFDGSLNDRQRDQILRSFQERERPSVLLMSVQAGGTGLTLTAANHVFHFDHWWNPAVARQAEGRAHRFGQEQTVFVHDIFTVGTIEERIYRLLQDKQNLFDTVIDDLSADFVQGKFSDDDLFGLFDLKPPSLPRPISTSTVESPWWAESVQKTQSSPATPKPTTSFQSTVSVPGSPNTSSTLDRLNPTEFEHFIARLYSQMGYKSTVTPQSSDHGIDVLGVRTTELGTERIVIQCKHMPQGIVGENMVRDLLGAWQMHRNADKAILVTSGRFSRNAVVVAEQHRIILIDRIDLIKLMSTYQVNP